MDQENATSQEEEQIEKAQFDEGFDLDEEDSANGQDAANDEPAEEQNEERLGDQPQEDPGQTQEVQAEYVPPAEDPGPPAIKTVEVDPALAGELEELKKLNPEAAAIAIEDSPDGEALRKRLQNYGAEQAQDRAEFLLYQRQQQQAKKIREQSEREEHNRNFYNVMKKEVPGYFAMINDPARKTETANYIKDLFAWIGAKPYREAVQMMETAQRGRDPGKVSALIKKFESERSGSGAPDPTGALAIPGRGATYAPVGIGDKDDFDAGWNIHN